jgi:hypothetical protein
MDEARSAHIRALLKEGLIEGSRIGMDKQQIEEIFKELLEGFPGNDGSVGNDDRCK